MTKRTFFQDERLRSLRAQFKQVARSGDDERLDGITRILASEGLSQEEIASLYIQATMHQDDLPNDFEPDLERAKALKKQFDPHPLECSCARCQPRVPGTNPEQLTS
ncbi:MAG: hypothetical protein GYB68_01895 [Chloroflexi bacterium]|nr:hypothetical protein [Chloroflexota bacterium]